MNPRESMFIFDCLHAAGPVGNLYFNQFLHDWPDVLLLSDEHWTSNINNILIFQHVENSIYRFKHSCYSNRHISLPWALGGLEAGFYWLNLVLLLGLYQACNPFLSFRVFFLHFICWDQFFNGWAISSPVWINMMDIIAHNYLRVQPWTFHNKQETLIIHPQIRNF